MSGCVGMLGTDEEERKKILRRYGDGVEYANDGMDNRNRGISEFNDENYESAIMRFEDGRRNYQRAKDEFSEALDVAYEIEHQEARDICDEAAEYTTLMDDALLYSVRAAEAAQDGDRDRWERNAERAEELEREAERLNVRDPSTLRSVLDLD